MITLPGVVIPIITRGHGLRNPCEGLGFEARACPGMPRPQPFTHAEKGDVSTHVIVTSVPDIYEATIERMHEVTEKPGQPGFRLASGTVHNIRLTVALRPVGPTALAILVEELARLGARVVINFDTALALSPSVEIGGIFLAPAAVKGDGVSRNYLPVEVPAIADFDLLRHIQQTLEIHNISARTTTVWSIDLYYINEAILEHGARIYGKYATIVDMDTAALYTVAMSRKLHAASILVVEASVAKGIERGSFIAGGTDELRRKVINSVHRLVKPLLEAAALHVEKDRARVSQGML